jgi:hypothetical protein
MASSAEKVPAECTLEADAASNIKSDCAEATLENAAKASKQQKATTRLISTRIGHWHSAAGRTLEEDAALAGPKQSSLRHRQGALLRSARGAARSLAAAASLRSGPAP